MSEANGDGDRPGLPEGWTEAAAGDVLKFEYGKGLPARSRKSGSVKVGASAGVVGSHDESLTDDPVIVIGRKGAAGNVFVIDGPSWVIDTAYYAVAPVGHDIHFLADQLGALGLERLDQSTAVPSLSREDLKRVRLRLPPLAEQRQIAANTTRRVAAIEAGQAELRRAYLQSEAYSAATLSAVFQGAAGDFQQQLRDAPRVKLREQADIKYGYTAKATNDVVGPRMLRITDIQKGHVDWDSVPYCMIADEKIATYRLAPGDIVFARSGATTGKSYLVDQDVPEAVYASYLIRVRPLERLTPDFLALFFQSADYWSYVRANSRGMAQPNLNGTILGDLDVPQPSLESQRAAVVAAVQRLSAVSRLQEAIGRAQARGSLLNKAALRATVLGDIRPQAPRRLVAEGKQ